MSETYYEVHLHPDGSCEVYDTIEERPSGAWPSARAWADAWIKEWRASEHGPACELANAMASPPTSAAVDLILVLVEATNGDDELLSWVGAGPLEDVIRNGGDDAAMIAADVERAARQDALFRKALSGVWLNDDVPAGVRARLAVFGARDFVAEHAMTAPEEAAYIADRKAKGWLGMSY